VVNLTTFSDMGELLYDGQIYAFALLVRPGTLP